MSSSLSAPRRFRHLRHHLAVIVTLTAPIVAGAAAAPGAAGDPPAAPGAKLAASEAAGLQALGDRDSAKGDYATAEIAYRQILNGPSFTPADQKTALLGLAHMYRRAGQLTKGAAVYEKFLKLFPDDPRVPDAFLDLGRTLRDMGAYELALTRFYSVINTTLKLPAQGWDHYTLLAKTAQFEIAQTYYEEGDFAQAGKFFTRVRLLDLAPTDRARAHFMAGCAEQRAGELEAAATTLHDYLEQWPADENVPEARYVLATTLDELNRHQEAMAVTLSLLNAEHAKIASDPKRWNYWQRRTGNQLANRFFQSGNTLDALKIYSYLTALSDDPGWRLPIVYQTALCYERLFQTDRARAAYQAVVDAAKPAKGSAPMPEIVELASMASWRIQHLEWRDDMNRKLTKLIVPDKVPAAPAKPADAPAAPPPSPPPAS
ncbi:MAG TPA: tetratricopeptide repeat protein [Opitutaceae bacterium]|nr:tetratricopeptide repeat protein [Opitutaceae bacterium]